MTKNVPSRYHPLQVTLHWLIVLLVFAAFILGTSMTRLPNDDAAKLTPLAIHMSIGILTLIVIVVRILARMKLPKPAYPRQAAPSSNGAGWRKRLWATAQAPSRIEAGFRSQSQFHAGRRGTPAYPELTLIFRRLNESPLSPPQRRRPIPRR